MSQIENVKIQIRARLNEQHIKLWEAPYYDESAGQSSDALIDAIAVEFGNSLSLPISVCKTALFELQENALRKLAARKEFDTTGIATFYIRRVGYQDHPEITVKCSINILGRDLLEIIATELKISVVASLKCIARGKILDLEKTLQVQGLTNNQTLMIIVVNDVQLDSYASNDAMHDRVRSIRTDVDSVVNSKIQFIEMEDQDGNPVFLPPEENKKLLSALAIYEKARACLKRQSFEEALILLLESDGIFINCDSSYLTKIDNYALVNLDIVWCYLCLKNLNELPDAKRRLNICETSFRRSYGDDMSRLIALKGNSCPERALLMRLHLLQGVVLFHQNLRNEAYTMFEMAEKELLALKVNEEYMTNLVEMGYEPFEARLGLRTCNNNIELAINFIHDRRDKLLETRKKSKKERQMNYRLSQNEKEWVNPRSVCTLSELGYPKRLVIEALKRAKNDLNLALNLLQNNAHELLANIPTTSRATETVADEHLLAQLTQMGFIESIARVALELHDNKVNLAVRYILQSLSTEEELMACVQRLNLIENNSHLESVHSDPPGDAPTTIDENLQTININAEDIEDTLTDDDGVLPNPNANLINVEFLRNTIEITKKFINDMKAYKRFNKDIVDNEADYLDLDLEQEEQFLAQYKHLLEQ